jgi:hypothetical protein
LNIPATRIIRAVEPRHALVAVPDYQRSDVSKIAKIAKPALIAHRFSGMSESFDRGSL